MRPGAWKAYAKWLWRRTRDEGAISRIMYPDPSGGMTVEGKHWAATLFAQNFSRLLYETPEAKNYLEMRYETADGPLLVTVHKPHGKSPGTLVSELKARVAELEARLESDGRL